MSTKTKLVAEVAMTAILVVMFADNALAQNASLATDKAKTAATKAANKAPRKGDRARKDKKAQSQATANPTPESQPKFVNDSGRLEGDIVVTGLRENVKSARNTKRNAQQVVDVVLAQDIGKLPDKNVPEALARVPGVQIDRERGEGGTVKIRGLEGVMTTINGSPTFSAGERTTFLNDISSDLVAGIEVYKTRTPDQVEGSQTGVINITLRRPTDFKQGATYALSARADYADQVKKFNPYYSALIAYNTDTNIGRLGFSVNGTYNRVQYDEGVRFNELPQLLTSIRQNISPTNTPARIYAPFRVGFAGRNGWSKRAAFQISTQWQPDDHWKATLEAGYSNQHMLWADNLLFIPIRYSESDAPPPNLSNIVMSDDGRLVKSLSIYGLDPFGPGRDSYLHETSNYNGRYQVEYNSDRFEFNGWVNYVRSDNDSNNIFHWIRFSQQPRVDVVFNDPNDPKGGSNVTFKNIDLLDRNNYLYIDGFEQRREYTYSAETEIKGDVRINSLGSTIDWIKVGYRYASRTYKRERGERSYGALRLPMSGLPDYTLTEIGRSFQGSQSAANANWLIGDSSSIRKSFPAIRAQLSGIIPDLLNPYPQYDPYQAYSGSDGSSAFYAMFHYNVKLLFPIEGVIGGRGVNSLTALSALQHTEKWENINNSYQNVSTDVINTPRGNYFDFMPSLNAIIHFTPKLQLRTSLTREIGRPSSRDINPALYIDTRDASRPTASGGNAKLGAIQTVKYDASLEWYFGSTGSISLAAWQWNQTGFIARRTLPEYLPETDGDVPTLVSRPYNLGKGRHRGIEGSATTFFTFLPGILKSFGASINGTLNITRQAYPTFDVDEKATYVYGPYLRVSKYIYNVIGFFERDGLNIRVAYNWRSRQQLWRDESNPYNNLFLDPVDRLDASINYDVNKHLTVAFEAANLTRAGNRSFWGSYEVPQDVGYFSRNFSASIRTRF